MPSDIFALLVGINNYSPNVGKLNGCLNDVQNFHDYLFISGEIMSIVSVGSNTKTTVPSSVTAAEKVAEANNVLVLIHGIIGDTEGIAGNALG